MQPQDQTDVHTERVKRIRPEELQRPENAIIENERNAHIDQMM